MLLRFRHLAAAVLVLGCTEERNQGCPRPEAPFRLEVMAETGSLPDDTHLTVFYQGGRLNSQYPPHEDYDVRHPPTDNIDVCCRTGAPVEGRLPAVLCGLSAPTRDASIDRDAADLVEAASEASVPSGSRDAESERGDADAHSEGKRSDAAAPSGSGAAEAILCELWTNGPADIVVTGATFPRLTRSLSVKFDECGPVTRDVRVIWTHVDGGR